MRFALGAAFLLAVSAPAGAQEGETALRPANNPGLWITSADYPASAIMKGDHGTVSFSLVITSEGTVSNCEATGGTAPEYLKQLTCFLITTRARFTPKRDDQNRAVEGVFDGTVRWQIPEDNAGLRRAPEEGTWDYSFIVETDGSVSDCRINILTGYDEVWACGYGDGPVYAPILDEDGNPVRRKVRMSGRVDFEDPDS